MSAEVYRAFDDDGRLLYIGSSVCVDARMRYHEQHSPWWPFHADLERTAYPTLTEARVAEKAAIATEHPRWNVAHRSPDHPDGFISMTYGRRSAPWLADDYARLREFHRWMGGAA